jgi:hypothetical protein
MANVTAITLESRVARWQPDCSNASRAAPTNH